MFSKDKRPVRQRNGLRRQEASSGRKLAPKRLKEPAALTIYDCKRLVCLCKDIIPQAPSIRNAVAEMLTSRREPRLRRSSFDRSKVFLVRLNVGRAARKYKNARPLRRTKPPKGAAFDYCIKRYLRLLNYQLLVFLGHAGNYALRSTRIRSYKRTLIICRCTGYCS